MNPISEFFVRNIIAVFFLYGLAFFAMGLALALASRRTSEFRFARAIIPLAAFGILHGIHEWIEMFQKIAVATGGYTPTLWHELLRLAVLATSFISLMAFGLSLLDPAENPRQRVYLPLLAMIGLWLGAAAIVLAAMRPAPGDGVVMADVLARYSLGIPAALLGAWAMMTQQRTFREHGMPQFGQDLVWCATALLLYGVIGQVFVPRTALFPSSVLNSAAFLQWFGVPVQLFRGLMATILAFYMVRALNAFDLEGQHRLEDANRAKLQAQAEALEGERSISRERERLNAELRQTTRELALLLELSNVLASPMTLEDRLQGVLQRLVHSLDFSDAGMIYLAEGTPTGARVRAHCGFDEANASRLYEQARELGWGCTQAPRVICRHLDGTVLVYTFEEAIRQSQCHVYDSPTTMIALSLTIHDQVIGSLVLVQTELDQQRPVALDDLDLMLGIANQLGLSIENARLSQEAQEREQMLGELLHQVVGAQESERQRIARELHDATGQSLTAIALGLRGVEAMLSGQDTPPRQTVAQVRELKTYSTEALGELHQIIADLRPSILDDMGLAAALKWYVQGLEDRYAAIRSEFILEGDPVRLPSQHETVLFRIAQEALANVAKHAQASQVTVVLRFAPRWVCLIVEDNGVGFVPEQVLHGKGVRPGWGLLGIQERAALLGGQYAIESEPGRGTQVWVSVPLTAQGQENGDVDNPTAAS